MKQAFEITRSQLVEIMQEWVAGYMKDPSKYGGLNEDGVGEAQADYILSKLSEKPNWKLNAATTQLKSTSEALKAKEIDGLEEGDISDLYEDIDLCLDRINGK